MEDEKLYQVGLKFIHGIGDVNAKQLLSYCGSAKAIFHTSRARLNKIPGIRASTISSIVSADILHRAEEEVEKCAALGINILFYTDPAYPSRLKLVNDAPVILFSRGGGDFNKQRIVAIVGTRKATSYGKSVTEQIVKDLQPHDAMIISGLAYGIDIAAHKAAMEQGLATTAVLAGGLDRVYPAQHKKYLADIMAKGALVGENFLGTTPEAHYFPARNRIIAGISDAVIVVETAEKGGALITAEIAYSYNREVFAVPGAIDHQYSRGCNKLIANQKANIYSGIDDLEYLLNWENAGEPAPKLQVLDVDNFEGDERKIIDVLLEFSDGLQVDELCWKSQVPINTTVAVLLNLEFAGHVKSLPGKKYKLT